MRVDLEKIKTLIKQSGLTQAQFAEKFGLTRMYLTQCLNGHKPISAKLIRNIAAAFSIAPDDLYVEGVAIPDVPEGETFIQCPCCKSMIGISLKVSKIKDPEDPFADKKSCDI